MISSMNSAPSTQLLAGKSALPAVLNAAPNLGTSQPAMDLAALLIGGVLAQIGGIEPDAKEGAGKRESGKAKAAPADGALMDGAGTIAPIAASGAGTLAALELAAAPPAVLRIDESKISADLDPRLLEKDAQDGPETDQTERAELQALPRLEDRELAALTQDAAAQNASGAPRERLTAAPRDPIDVAALSVLERPEPKLSARPAPNLTPANGAGLEAPLQSGKPLQDGSKVPDAAPDPLKPKGILADVPARLTDRSARASLAEQLPKVQNPEIQKPLASATSNAEMDKAGIAPPDTPRTLAKDAPLASLSKPADLAQALRAPQQFIEIRVGAAAKQAGTAETADAAANTQLPKDLLAKSPAAEARFAASPRPAEARPADDLVPERPSTATAPAASASTASPSAAIAAAAPAPAPAPATSSLAAQPVTLAGDRPLTAQVEQVIDQLSQAREASRSARPELTVRHAEFGAVNMRLEASGSDLRAFLSSRDPGFIPAVHAALNDRAAITSVETSNQTGGQTGSRQSESGQNTGQYGGQTAGNGGAAAGGDPRYGPFLGAGGRGSQPSSEHLDGERQDSHSRSAGQTGVQTMGPRENGLFA